MKVETRGKASREWTGKFGNPSILSCDCQEYHCIYDVRENRVLGTGGGRPFLAMITHLIQEENSSRMNFRE